MPHAEVLNPARRIAVLHTVDIVQGGSGKISAEIANGRVVSDSRAADIMSIGRSFLCAAMSLKADSRQK
jgi:hypothetical protein